MLGLGLGLTKRALSSACIAPSASLLLLEEGMSDAEGVKSMPSEFRTLRLERRGGAVALMPVALTPVSASRTPPSAP